MANSKHLAELKKGIKNWNRWRRENPGIIPDLRKADLRGFDLSFINFRDAKLVETRFSGACLHSANLSKADLSFSKLVGSNLKFASLNCSNLSQATLIKANLSEADLMKADLSEANLREANLSKANLRFTQLFKANLTKADLSLAVVKKAQLQNTDMSAVQGFGTSAKFVEHILPKMIEVVEKQYGFQVLDSKIFERRDISKAVERVQEIGDLIIPDPISIIDFNPQSLAAEEFEQLAKEVMQLACIN